MAGNDWLKWVLVIGVILYANSQGMIPGLNAAAPGPAVAEADQTGTLCLNDGAVMTVGPAQYRYAPTTALGTGDFHRVFIDGVDRGLKADSSTIDVTTPTRIGGTNGADVMIFYAENSTTFYAAKQAFKVPCVSAFSSGARPDSDAYKVIANGTSADVTITVFDDDDGLSNNGGTNNESMGASDTANLDVKINWPSKKGYSPYGKVYLTARFNTTAYDAGGMELSSSDSGVTVSEASTPTFRASLSSQTGYGLKTWTFAGYDALNTKVQHFNLHVETTATQPVIVDGTDGGNINLWLDDEDWFLNTETGIEELGTETNTDSNVGDTSNITKEIWIA